jgi:site-specific DNA-methyltransferase (adenine-specific)
VEALDLRLGRYQDVLGDVVCNAVIVDAPYSAKTHAGHDGAAGVREPSGWVKADGSVDAAVVRRGIDYTGWDQQDVAEFCDFWAQRCTGWIVTVTDHVLARVWEAELERTGRYVFAPLPYVAVGSRVRLAGDGPSNWTCQVVVARPKTRAFQHWGTLPGAYILPPGHAERGLVTGSKPSWLMRTLIRDYSRPGDLVCDPCAGGATTLLAAAQTGRRGVGAELSPETYAKAAKRLRDTPVAVDWLDTAPKREQGGLW